MMKKLYTYLLAAVTFFGVASCSDTPGEDIPNIQGEEVDVTLHISAANSVAETRTVSSNGITRASWTDNNAVDGEMMKNWIIVVANGDSIEYILQSSNSTEEKEQDEVTVKLTAGTEYTLYSFANIELKDLGLSTETTTLPEGFKDTTFAVSGNKDKVSDFTGGIPMSGVDTWKPTKRSESKDVEVYRMVAKVGIQFYNNTSSDITVKSVALTDITSDATGTDTNVKLFPTVDTDKNVTASLPENVSKATRTYNISNGQKVATYTDVKEWDKSKTPDVLFYVNESAASVPHYFQLTVETNDGSKKYAFLEWNSIARNEYVRIPVVLNDYYIDWDVQGFTAIGVLPTITKEQDKLIIKATSYGEFHITPKLYKSNDKKSTVSYTVNENGWSLKEPETPDIFDTTPYWNSEASLIEGSLNNKKGYAIYQLALTPQGQSATLSYSIEIVKE